MSLQNLLDSYYPLIKEMGNKYSIYPSVFLAISGIENSFNEPTQPCLRDDHNLF